MNHDSAQKIQIQDILKTLSVDFSEENLKYLFKGIRLQCTDKVKGVFDTKPAWDNDLVKSNISKELL